MRIGRKISLSFAFAMAVLLASMGVSIYNFQKINTIVDDINNDKIVEFALAHDLVDAINQQRIIVRNMIIQDDPREIASLAEQAKKLNSKIDEYLATYKVRITTPGGLKMLKDINDASANYRSTLGNTINAGLAGQKDVATKLIVSELTPEGDQFVNNVMTLLQLVKRLMDGEVAETTEAYASSKILLISILVIAVILMVAMSVFLSRSITRPIQKAVNAAKSISHGDFKVDLHSTAKDETATLMHEFEEMVNTIRDLIKENNLVAENSSAGNFSYRADSSKFQGEYRNMVDGTNSIVDALAIPLTMMKDLMLKLSNGELPEKVVDETRKGDFISLKEAINQLLDTLAQLDVDARAIVDSIKNGNLIKTRADADKHKGIFKEIMLGYNNMLDLIVSSLEETMSVIGRLSNGDLKARMVKE